MSVKDFIVQKDLNIIFTTNTTSTIIACDSDMMERIILNLLSNAIKFNSLNGTITVSVMDKGDRIVISVKDTGIGIPQDKKEIIFERFKQVNKSLTREKEGSGIGLSLTKSLVEMHYGTISVESEPGYGSEFIIELPIRLISSPIHKKDMKLPVANKSFIERINVEFSDIYS